MLEVVISPTFLSRPGVVAARLEGNRIRLRTPRMTSYLASLRPQVITMISKGSSTWMAEKFHDLKLASTSPWMAEEFQGHDFKLATWDELMTNDDPKPGPLEWKAARAQSREAGLKKVGKRWSK